MDVGGGGNVCVNLLTGSGWRNWTGDLNTSFFAPDFIDVDEVTHVVNWVDFGPTEVPSISTYEQLQVGLNNATPGVPYLVLEDTETELDRMTAEIT